MKFAILSSLVAAATAFSPASLSVTRPSTAVSGEQVPCDGAAPLFGDNSVFLGKNYWDKLTSEYGSADTGKFLRAAEIKHGRSAMLATVGFAFHKLGFTLDKISPHEYLSVTEGVKFADLAAMTPADAMHHVPAAGLTQMFMAITAVEIYELTHSKDELVRGSRVAPGLQAGGLTGDLGWNPLDIKITERRKLAELQNGRAAMFAISAWVSHDAIQGSVPFPPLPWN